jgi:hypothetical protein
MKRKKIMTDGKMLKMHTIYTLLVHEYVNDLAKTHNVPEETIFDMLNSETFRRLILVRRYWEIIN